MTAYITMDEALRIHTVLLEEFGGAGGVRDLGLLDSALNRPQSGYYRDLIEEAAALWESLAMNHPFVDGNKRVAYAVGELFLQLNGVDISPDNKTVETFIYSNLEAGTFNKDVLDAWLRSNTRLL
ncbi:MAG: type II toxin-antitoxin system death-on-curing family toxin [Devosia sp.]